MKEVYALVWRTNASSEEFEKRIPALMTWLRELYSEKKLLGCGGGGYEIDNGGLTLLDVSSLEEAQKIMATYPMNDIGTIELFIWDVFFADLVVRENEHKLKAP